MKSFTKLPRQSVQQLYPICTVKKAPVSAEQPKKLVPSVTYKTAMVKVFRAPTGPENIWQAKTYKKGEGFGFAEIDGVDYFFHISDCSAFQRVADPNDNLQLSVEPQRDRLRFADPPTIGEKIVVLEVGPGKNGRPSILKWSFLKQKELLEKQLGEIRRWRFVEYISVGSKMGMSPKIIWEGNNPEKIHLEMMLNWNSLKSSSETIRGVVCWTIRLFETKLPSEPTWQKIKNCHSTNSIN